MEYVMNDLEKELYKLVEQNGIQAPISALVRALIEFAHDQSDMGLKEQAREAMEAADMLKDVRDSLNE